MPLTLKNIKEQEEFHRLNPSEVPIGECFKCKQPLTLWEWYRINPSYCLYCFAQLPYDIKNRFYQITEKAKWTTEKALHLIIDEMTGNSEWVTADLSEEVRDYCEAQLARKELK